jgi:RNA polymerase sigma-70 factor (ECF subfamily)
LDVDPSLSEIKVTFSKDMMTNKMWSWCMASKDSFPKIIGESHYLKDKRTCVLPVKLEPGKTYAIWINTSKWMNFRDTYKNPAVPYLLVFKTKAK